MGKHRETVAEAEDSCAMRKSLLDLATPLILASTDSQLAKSKRLNFNVLVE
jgi:hypothetical protein